MKRIDRPALSALLLFCLVMAGCKKNSTEEKNIDSHSSSRSSNSSPIVPSYNLPIRAVNEFKWGTNGHPLTQPAYWNNLPLQIDLLKELQASMYIFDVSHNQQGEITELTRFNALNAAASAGNITLIPVIFPPPNAELFAMGISEAFDKGKILGKGFASRYKQYFDYYKLGNEMDIHMMLPTNPAGDEIEDYVIAKFNVWASFLKGMIAGVDEEDPTALTLVNNGGWKHYGYFRLLAQANVNYDIIGYHWYNDAGTDFNEVLNVLTSEFISKPVWFSEVNHKRSLEIDDLALNGAQLEAIIQQLDNRMNNIRGFFTYELFDEPYLTNAPPIERKIGMVSWDNPFTTIIPKPAYRIYKRKIEEYYRGYENLVYSLYLYCNGRVPDPGGLSYWTSQAASTRNNPSIIRSFLPGEAYGLFVNQTFQNLYDRAADPGAQTYYTNQMINGSTREDLIKEFTNNDEFWTLSGSNYTGFVNRVFARLLNRTATGAEVTQWTTGLNNGTITKLNMVNSIIHGDEYLRIFVRAQFNALLRRNNNIDAGSENWAVGLMNDGMNQWDFILTLLYSYEFWERALEEGYERNNAPYTW